LTTIPHRISILLNPLPRFLYNFMPDQKYPQFSRNRLRSPSHETFSAQPLRGVRQDKRGLSSARKSIKQPARIHTPAARIAVNNTSDRSQNHFSANAPLVQLPLWVKPIVKAEVKRMAEINGISPSAQGADLLEEILRQKLHIQQAATLETALEKIITRIIGKRDARLAYLLVRIAFATEQGRILDTNILSRMPGVTPTIRDKILDRSANAAKSKIKQSSPQLEDIMRELEEMLSQQEGRAEKT
jgi:hypothetical protein